MPDLGAAIGLMLLIEGLLPLLAPSAWRAAFARMLALNDGQIRFVGLASIALGVLTLLLLS
jgi:uncharacterized protein YjeT (DUF2065 family)